MPKATFFKLSAKKQDDFWRAAIRAFAACGYDGTSVSTLAQACGVATGLIYLYFDHKENLYTEVCQEAIKRWREALFRDNLAEKDIFTILEEMIRRGAMLCAEEPDLLILYSRNLPANEELAASVEDRAATLLKDKIALALTAGKLPPDLDVPMAAFICHSLFLNFCSSLLIAQQKQRLRLYLGCEELITAQNSGYYQAKTLRAIQRALGV